MKLYIVFSLLISVVFSQQDSLKMDSLFTSRLQLFITNKPVKQFNLSFEDSVRPVWKGAFRSQSSELDILSEHLKNPRYERNFVGIDLLGGLFSLLEWVGLKTDDEGRDKYQQELYEEELWKAEQGLDSLLILNPNDTSKHNNQNSTLDVIN